MPELDRYCVYNSQAVDGNVFVGFRVENNIPKVYFPYGYRHSETDKEIRRDILNLFSVLSSYIPKTNEISKSGKDKSLPLHALIGVYSYFLTNGYFVERETIYKKSPYGKINWSKTIKNIKPIISRNRPVYLEFIAQNSLVDENKIITQIHKFCLCKSYEIIGKLFNFPKTEPATIPENIKFFVSVLLNKISNTFDERKIKLFRDMVDILVFFSSENNNKTTYGTLEFHHIWEKLIDSVFGISNKEDYFPHYSYSKLENNQKQVLTDQPLFPDTIMISNGKVFVLDAKFYPYGFTRRVEDLPGAESINKQMSYAEYVETKFNKDGNDIYNAFILPYNSETESFGFKKDLVVDVNWKNKHKNYEKIYGILLDTRFIMYHHTHSDIDIEVLSRVIEEA